MTTTSVSTSALTTPHSAAPTRLAAVRIAESDRPAGHPPQPSGLTRSELRQIVLDIIG